MSDALSGAQLGRQSPPAAWEGYFLIGVFPPGSELKWAKLHLFSGGRYPGRHCLSAVEGLDGAGEQVLLLGTATGVETHRKSLNGEFAREEDRWRLSGAELTWAGEYPRLELKCRNPAVRVSTESKDVLWWVKAGRVLTYWTSFGKLEWNGSKGVALVEHAWGGATRWMNPARLAPKRWQWDVLTFEDGSACAGLWAEMFGKQRGLRAGGRVPGETFAPGNPRAHDVTLWRQETDRRIPARWTGAMALGDGLLEYEARASTPVAPTYPGGGFLGFDFTAYWRRGRARSRIAGTGFCEYRAG